MHPLPHTYQINCTFTGNKEASVGCAGQPTIKMSVPKEFDGPNTGWSPEAMFLNALAGCVAFTFSTIAGMMKLDFSNLMIAATGTVEAHPDKRMYFSKVTLQPSLTLANPADESKLPKMWENTEKHCLVSNSVQCPVEIQPPQIG
jgi:peroxiredoxin-like protein